VSDSKLAELTTNGGFRLKVKMTLDSLREHGENPKVFEGKRTLAQQRDKVKAGVSRTVLSYHLRRGSDGGACAADVADAKTGWRASIRFWLLLGANAQARGMGWGGLFGLSRKQKAQLVAVIEECRAVKWQEDAAVFDRKIVLGWDPAHVQTGDNW